MKYFPPPTIGCRSGAGFVGRKARFGGIDRVMRSIIMVADGPLGMSGRAQDDIRQSDRIAAGLDPACAVARIAGRATAAEADEIDLGIPLPAAATDGT